MWSSGSVKGVCIFLSWSAIFATKPPLGTSRSLCVAPFKLFWQSLRKIMLNSHRCLVYSVNEVHHKVPGWIILETINTVEPQELSESPVETLGRKLKKPIFENTSLIKGLTTLFQDSDPSLNIMSTIFQSMILSGSVRNTDSQHLASLTELHPKNDKFLQTFGRVVSWRDGWCSKMQCQPRKKDHICTGLVEWMTFLKIHPRITLFRCHPYFQTQISSRQVTNFMNMFYYYLV